MRAYREFEPPSDLVAIVQCLWTHETDGAEPGYRVLPDGCADILFIRENGEPQRLDVIGTMTRAQRFDLPARRMTIALRFRPGMAALGLRVPANELTDAAIPLDDLLGSRGARRASACRKPAPSHSTSARCAGCCRPRRPSSRFTEPFSSWQRRHPTFRSKRWPRWPTSARGSSAASAIAKRD